MRRAAGAAAAALALLLAGPAPAAPPEERPELVTRVAGAVAIHALPVDAGLLDVLAVAAPAGLERITATLDVPAPPRIDVYLLPRRSRVDPRALGLPGGPPWASGLALGSSPTVVLRTHEVHGASGTELATTLVHELAHVVVDQHLGEHRAELPRYVREGLAQWLAFDWGLGDFADAVSLSASGGFLPLSSLRTRFPAAEGAARLAYLESFSFVAWLVDRHGVAGVRDILARVRAGEDYDAALRAACGASEAELERLWLRRFRLVHRWVPLVTSTATLWLVVTAAAFAAWARRRRRAAATMRRWEEDEAASGEPEGEEPEA